MAENYESTANSASAARNQTPAEAEESFHALVRALRAIRPTGAADARRRRAPVGREQPAP